MNKLKVKPPFVWPEPRALEALGDYEHAPPFGQLALESRSLFGVVTAITSKGVNILADWLNHNPQLKISLIVTVYPTCATRQEDLSGLLGLMYHASGRLSVYIHPLEFAGDRAANALCFLASDSDTIHLVTGSSEDLGQFSINKQAHINFALRADAVLFENFKRYFDWLLAKSQKLTTRRVVCIPHLVLPKGTEEAALLWRNFIADCKSTDVPKETAQIAARVDPVTGEVKLVDKDSKQINSIAEELGFPKLDQLSERTARLYEKGALVSIDKLSRVPPLDAPLSPGLFGDVSDLQIRNVSRKVSMRVSVIDEKMLKDIDRRRQGIRPLLTKFTFALADNTRWIPNTVKALFESEVKRVSDEGQKLISDLLKGDLDEFLKSKRPQLVSDINAMCDQIGRAGQVSEDLINEVVGDLKGRLSKVQSANLMPKLSYSILNFSRTENDFVSPWGQAYSLLAGIVAFPRKALTNAFFFRGLKVSEDDLIEIMNVADDSLCRDLRARGIKERCRGELDLLERIEKAPIESKDRCELMWQLLDGDSIGVIDEALKKKEAQYENEKDLASVQKDSVLTLVHC